MWNVYCLVDRAERHDFDQDLYTVPIFLFGSYVLEIALSTCDHQLYIFTLNVYCSVFSNVLERFISNHYWFVVWYYCTNRLFYISKKSSRKAWLLIIIFAIHSPFLLPSFLWRKRKEEKTTKVVVKSHAFLLDLVKSFFSALYNICNKLYC